MRFLESPKIRRWFLMEVIIISAVAKNLVIGKDGDIPWRISEDFQHFKKVTLGYPCVMGDVTYRSLPENARPLPGRENVVLTFDKDYKPEGVTVMHDFDEAIEYCKNKYDKVFITGGATIYRLGLKVADKLMLTELSKEFDGDTFFPEFNKDEWKEIERETHHNDKYDMDYSFVVYKRII